MSTQFPVPPTYADPVIADEISGRVKFNPIWLKWFLDLAQLLTQAGGGSGAFTHNDLAGLQGGSTNDYYHVTSAQSTSLLAVIANQTANTVFSGPSSGAAAAPSFRALVSADFPALYPRTPAGATQTAAALYAGTGAPSNADGANGDFYFRSDGGALTAIYQKRAGAWVGIV